jgi:hypothetical protein
MIILFTNDDMVEFANYVNSEERAVLHANRNSSLETETPLPSTITGLDLNDWLDLKIVN